MSMCKCNEKYIKLAHAIGEYEGIVSSLEFDLKEKFWYNYNIKLGGLYYEWIR